MLVYLAQLLSLNAYNVLRVLPVRFALLDLLVQLVPPAQLDISIMEEFVILALLQSTISVNHVLLRILVQYA